MSHDLIEEARADARRFELAFDHTFRIDSRLLEPEDFLHRDYLTFHAGELGYADDLAAAVGEAGDLHHDVEGGRDLRARRTRRDVDTAHADHLLDTGQSVARRVGVDGGHRPFV